MSTAEMIRIMIVDDLAQVRRGLRTVLELMEDLLVVGEAANGFEAVQMVERLSPDIVLMDLEMPGMDGFEATRQIKGRRRATGVVALTIHGHNGARRQADLAGVDAFVEKGTGVEILTNTIRHVFGELCA